MWAWLFWQPSWPAIPGIKPLGFPINNQGLFIPFSLALCLPFLLPQPPPPQATPSPPPPRLPPGQKGPLRRFIMSFIEYATLESGNGYELNQDAVQEFWESSRLLPLPLRRPIINPCHWQPFPQPNEGLHPSADQKQPHRKMLKSLLSCG